MDTIIQVKPRNATEVKFIEDVTKTSKEIIKMFGLNIQKIRFARKAGWGGNGAAHCHSYKYRDGSFEFWVNIRNVELDQEYKDYLKAALVSGAKYWDLKANPKTLDYTDADATLYVMRTGKTLDRLMQGKARMPIAAKRFLVEQRYTYETTSIYEAEANRKLRERLQAA